MMYLPCDHCRGLGYHRPIASTNFPPVCGVCKGAGRVELTEALRERGRTLDRVLRLRSGSAVCARILGKIPEAWLG